MDKKQRQGELAKLIAEQATDDKSRYVAPEYTMRRTAMRPKRPQAIQTRNPRLLDAMVAQDAAKRLDIEGPRPSDYNIETEYDRECAEKWQIAINKAKQQIKRPEDGSRSQNSNHRTLTYP